jgi:antitoxin ParD1/3/4
MFEDVVMIMLTPELERLVQEKIESGSCLSADEVIHTALRLLDERDQMRQRWRAGLQQQVALGLEQLNRGEGIPGEEVFEKLRQKGPGR